MEHQPRCSAPIKHIAHNGAPQPRRMGGVHAQLVRAPGEWMKMHQSAPVATALHHFVARNGAFAMQGVHHLARSVGNVGS